MKTHSPILATNTRSIATYLQKLGFFSPPEPTLEVLTLLQKRHTTLFPFQTLTTVMHQPVSLDWHHMVNKVIITNQGGYCYELNMLFYGLLSSLGYETAIFSGHVIHDTNFIRRSPRTHILVGVHLDDEEYICDVGHGGYTPTQPLHLHWQGPQPTPYGLYTLAHEDDWYYLQIVVGESLKTLYGFNLHPQHLTDLEVGNWYVWTHPDSLFRQTLMVARTDEGGKRHALLNNRYSIHTFGQKSIVQQLHGAPEIIEVIENQFGLYIPDKQQATTSIANLLLSLSGDAPVDDSPHMRAP